MLRAALETRALAAMIIAAGVGTCGLRAYPVPSDDLFLGLIEARTPLVFHVLAYGYATLWFTTPFFVASLFASLVTIVVYRRAPATRFRNLPPYPNVDGRQRPALVLGETHYATTPGRSPHPQWLTIPQRGLYTGVMILGAVGTGKTSACMYPYVDQLFGWRAGAPDRKLGGLILEVKGDFCGHVQRMLQAAGREADYLDIGLNQRLLQ